MTAKKFVSKADTWLLLVLLASMLLLVVGVGVSLYSETSALRAAGVLIVTLLVLLLIGSVVFRTYYLIDGNHLKIVSGPFRWMVSIDEITRIERTRNPLSSPALSLDRLRIRYSNNKSIMISPADRKRFMNALGLELSE